MESDWAKALKDVPPKKLKLILRAFMKEYHKDLLVQKQIIGLMQLKTVKYYKLGEFMETVDEIYEKIGHAIVDSIKVDDWNNAQLAL